MTARACKDCGGQGGFPDTTPKPGGGHVTVWRPCTSCGGRGTR
ncbi:hypothetical protein [Streptomyces sp. EAS-AB2608]|nr:hypothetical protein [Streptomyces sp. EAS-AB2608]